METLSVLLVDDEQRVRDELDEFLTNQGYQVWQAGLPSEAFTSIQAHDPDIVLLDIMLPEMDGLEVLQRIKTSDQEREVIMITGHGDMHSVIQALRLGASDYLNKPFLLAEVQAAIERTRKYIQLTKKLKAVESNYAFVAHELAEQIGSQIIGTSPAMQTVLEMMTRVAGTENTPVLITGESGTGKELVAHGIHALSARKESPFYSVNVAAISGDLFESEFFGHVRGAFTGATREKRGWFEVAHQSTLFLDEIADLDLALQGKLLRVLEEHAVFRVGAHTPIPVDVRLIAATNTPITQRVQNRQFRLDLYHRLNTVCIHLPPLRERPEDIPRLLNHFMALSAQKMNKPITGITAAAQQALYTYPFPGNVRELKNMVERAIIFCDGSVLQLSHFPGLSPQTPIPEHDKRDSLNLTAMERRLILEALARTRQNKSQAAKLLGISWQALDRRLKKFGLA